MEGVMKTTDWYPWLRRAFDPPCASEYAGLFTRNELEEEDIGEFTHDFLLSMGISIAKHRLKILKLARTTTTTTTATRMKKTTRRRRRRMRMWKPTPRLVSMFVAVLDKARRGLERLVVVVVVGVHRDPSPPVATTPPTPAITEIGAATKARRGAGLKKNKRVAVNYKRGISPALVPVVLDGGGGGGGANGGEFKWDAMFQNLRPT